MLDSYDYLYKIVIIGDSAVGKTGLLLRITQNQFITDTKPTIGVEFDAKTVTIDGKKVKAQIWDTAGQERYRAITSAYYRGTVGAFIVYDITNTESYTNAMERWLNKLREHTDDIPIAIVGNKTDLNAKVDTAKARKEAENNKLMYFETSALNGDNVNEAFVGLMKKVYEKNTAGKHKKFQKTVKLDKAEGKEMKKKGCC